MRAAHAVAPPKSASRSIASGAERVSFQSIAGRSGLPAASRQTRPCCCPATEIAAIWLASPVWARARQRASHQTSGWVSRAPPVPLTVCWARPVPTISPLSESTTTTLVDWVEQSTPAMSVFTDSPQVAFDLPRSHEQLHHELVQAFVAAVSPSQLGWVAGGGGELCGGLG